MVDSITPLTAAQIGQPLTLVRISAGRALKLRLVEMGLTPGTELRILQDNGGPMIVAVRGSRLAVGRSMAHKLLVRGR